MTKIIRDIMCEKILEIFPGNTVQEAAVLMEIGNIGSVIVISESKSLKGIVTDRDIVVRCVSKGKEPAKTLVSEIMTENVAFLSPEDHVSDVIDLMRDGKIRRVPILENDVVVGVVSFADIARYDGGPEVLQAISEISESSSHPSDIPKA